MYNSPLARGFSKPLIEAGMPSCDLTDLLALVEEDTRSVEKKEFEEFSDKKEDVWERMGFLKKEVINQAERVKVWSTRGSFHSTSIISLSHPDWEVTSFQPSQVFRPEESQGNYIIYDPVVDRKGGLLFILVEHELTFINISACNNRRVHEKIEKLLMKKSSSCLMGYGRVYCGGTLVYKVLGNEP